MLTDGTIDYYLVNFCFGALMLALALAFVRVVRGQTMPDRVVALDLVSSIIIGITALYAVVFDVRVLLDVAICIALITFLGTVAFAQYIERKAKDE